MLNFWVYGGNEDFGIEWQTLLNGKRFVGMFLCSEVKMVHILC